MEEDKELEDDRPGYYLAITIAIVDRSNPTQPLNRKPLLFVPQASHRLEPGTAVM